MFNSFPIPMPDSGGSNIKSAQNGSTAWTDSNTTLDIAISNVDPNKSIIRILYLNTGNSATISSIAPTFVNGTTIRLNRNTVGSLTTDIIYWIVEEYNNVKSKQTGTLLGNGSEQIVAVSTYNITKSSLYLHQTSSTADAFYKSFGGSGRIKTSSTIGLTSTTGTTVYYQLLEFN